MSKRKAAAYSCVSCGHNEAKWLGRCPVCGEWNTFHEKHISRKSETKRIPELLSAIDPSPPEMHPTGIDELDRVLGGGLAPGASVLIGGEPGIGKSTLMLQAAASIAGMGLYVSGEETPGQLKNRADRMNIRQDRLSILRETDLDILLDTLDNTNPAYVIVDSIQTLSSSEAGAVPGTPGQLRIVGQKLADWAKTTRVPVFLVAHVTKEGIIAGPKVVEHLVDAVLYFDHAPGDLRILRASKNRMGSADEIGLFRMDSKGLDPILDPSGLFLEHRKSGPPAGSSVTAVYEGSRILLVEIQALVVPAKGEGGRVYSDRIETARVSRIAAVLERHAGLRLANQDIYVNVAGGLRIGDTGAELAVALAIVSARAEKPLPANLAAFGEITLAGEIRPVSHLRRRVKASVEAGMDFWFAAFPEDIAELPGGHPASTVRDAVAAVLSG